MATNLTDDQLRILAEFGLPSDRPITNDDLMRPGSPRAYAIVRDFGHLRRLKAQPHPFPDGKWLSENIKIYLPSEMANWLLGLPTEKPSTVAPERPKPKPTKAKAVTKRAAPKKRRARR